MNMRIRRTHGILLGMSILGATGLWSSTSPAQASPVIQQVQYSERLTRSGRTYQLLTGKVTRNYGGNDFLLMIDRGSTYRIRVLAGKPRSVSYGDRVQVYGYYRGGVFQAQQFKMIRNR
jgi:hypothetical protein